MTIFSSRRHNVEPGACATLVPGLKPGPDVVTASDSANTPDDAPYYDYIVLGAGTSGSVLANRLSESDSHSVLLLERGNYLNDVVGRIPLLSNARAFQERYATHVRTTPQPGLGGRTSTAQVGRQVGGSSAVNATLYTRGCYADFDSWGMAGYTGTELEQYFVKSQTHSHKASSSVSSSNSKEMATYGYNGPWATRDMPQLFGFSTPFIKAAGALGVPTSDYGMSSQGMMATGAFFLQTSQTTEGARHHAGAAYLSSEVLAQRRNLKLCVDSCVEKVEVEEGGEDKTHVTGVWFSNKGKVYFARSNNIILSSGAIFSPCILQRSGIGPPSVLEPLRIPIKVALEDVGSNFKDHLAVPLHFRGPMRDSCMPMVLPMTALPTLIHQAWKYFVQGKGWFTTPGTLETVVYLNSEQIQLINDDDGKDESATPPKLPRLRVQCQDPHKQVPDIEISFEAFWAAEDMPKFYGLGGSHGVMAALVYLVKPKATGHVHITAPDPSVLPEVEPNFLREEEDVRRLVLAIRLAISFVKHMREEIGYDIGPACVPGWDDAKGGWKSGLTKAGKDEYDFVEPSAIDEKDIIAHIQKWGFGVQHMASTCAMGSVVEPGTLQVKGVKGLRVCDVSVMPNVLSCHPQAAAIAIAEKLASDIEREK